MEQLICVDGEIENAIREIEEFLNNTMMSIVAYNVVLKRVQMNAIQDDLLREKIGNLSVSLKLVKEKLEYIQEQFSKYGREFLTEFEKNDKYRFPLDFFSEVEMLIKMIK